MSPVTVSHEIKLGKCNDIRDLSSSTVITIKNPFTNLLDMITTYFNIYKSNDDALLEFVTSPTKNGNEFDDVDYDFLFFLSDMYRSTFNPDSNDPWMSFDENVLDDILKDSFFDEYNAWSYNHIPKYKYDKEKLKKQAKDPVFLKTIKKHSKSLEIDVFDRKYPLLELYTYTRLQAIACTKLSKDYLWDVNSIWTYHDLIVELFDNDFYDTIAMVYKSYGFHWFADHAETDPVKYKWACLAIAACKKAGNIPNSELKKDLTDIYKELLIAFAIRNSVDKNQDIISYVADCINNFDNAKIENLVVHIENLKQENDYLINKNKQLTDGMSMLRSQLRDLQKDNSISDDDVIEEMVYRIYMLSPQNEDLDDNSMDFKTIWDRLDKSTKKNIKVSISMFKQFESFDMALFPMISSLEHEFARNFFIPFHMSNNYINAGIPICTSKRYQRTHDSLLKNGTIHPTMGNIPFIGRAMSDVKAQNASNIIKAFRVFLDKNRSNFINICKALDTYRIGAKQYKLVDLRNGIAHGDNGVTENIDKKCYEETSKLLYEPPLQILFNVIRYSMK